MSSFPVKPEITYTKKIETGMIGYFRSDQTIVQSLKSIPSEIALERFTKPKSFQKSK